tara:strand:- start:436 stop:567 length:132 start_codon:yes stop_codon:yes gene_type:complete
MWAGSPEEIKKKREQQKSREKFQLLAIQQATQLEMIQIYIQEF